MIQILKFLRQKNLAWHGDAKDTRPTFAMIGKHN